MLATDVLLDARVRPGSVRKVGTVSAECVLLICPLAVRLEPAVLSRRGRRAGLRGRVDVPFTKSAAFFGVRESGLVAWTRWVGEAAEDGGVRSTASAVGRMDPETSLADDGRSAAGRECWEVVELWELLSNEVTGRTCGEDTGDMEGRRGEGAAATAKELRAGSCRPSAAARGTVSMQSEGCSRSVYAGHRPDSRVRVGLSLVLVRVLVLVHGDPTNVVRRVGGPNASIFTPTVQTV